MKFAYKVTGKFLKLSKGKIMNGVMAILPYMLCIWFLLVFLSSTKSVFQTNPKAIQEHRFRDWAVQTLRLGNLNLLIILSLCGFGRSRQKAELTSPKIGAVKLCLVLISAMPFVVRCILGRRVLRAEC